MPETVYINLGNVSIDNVRISPEAATSIANAAFPDNAEVLQQVGVEPDHQLVTAAEKESWNNPHGATGPTGPDGPPGPYMIGKTTLALLNDDLDHAADTLARVTNDPDINNNGTYIKLGGSGVGSWQKEDTELPDAAMTALVGEETRALALDTTANEAYTVKVVDADAPAKDFLGRIEDLLGTVCASPKMVTKEDGSLGWTDHNIMQYSSDLTSVNWTATTTTRTGGQADSDGGTNAVLMTATNTTSSIRKNSAASIQGRWHTGQFIVKAGTSDHCYINLAATADARAYFNLGAGTVGTVDAGVVASIHTDRVDGTALPAGFYRIVASIRAATGTVTLWFGQCDADNSTAVTSGRTIYVEKASLHFGKVPLKYMETVGAAYNYGGYPWDWSKGGRRLLLEGAATYNSKHGDDLTQAEWVKTDCTAAYDATGPHGQECSTLTATGANATCLQSITSASNSQYFSAYVKRKTGAGSVYITSDGGSTWTDVTALIGSTGFTRVAVLGNANPSVGFKVATSGDEVEISLALNVNADCVSSPVPTHGAATVVRVTDSFLLPVAKFPSSAEYSVYVDVDRGSFPVAGTIASVPVALRNAANTEYTRIITDNPSGEYVYGWTTTGGSVYASMWSFTVGERIQAAFRWKSGDVGCSFNSDPSLFIPGASSAFTVDHLGCNAGGTVPVYLRRIVVIPRTLTDDELRLWKYSGTPTITEDSTAIREQAAAGVLGARAPSVAVLADDGDTVTVIVGADQKNSVTNGTHSEQPCRGVARRFTYTRSTGVLTPIDNDFFVTYEQPGWAAGNGSMSHGGFIKIRSGKHKGRVLMIGYLNDDPGGDAGPVNRRLNTYVWHSDENGEPGTWSAPTKIADCAAYDGKVIIPGSNGAIIQFPADSAYPHRIALPLWSTNTRQHIIYTDDGGDTWTVGATMSGIPANYTLLSEANITLRPDGKIIVTTRVDTDTNGFQGKRILAFSTDGGATLAYDSSLNNFVICNGGIVQLDPTGNNGSFGKVLLSHPYAGTNVRKNFSIQGSTKDKLTSLSDLRPINAARYIGYSSMARIDGGLIALAYETGTIPFNVDNSAHLAILEV